MKTYKKSENSKKIEKISLNGAKTAREILRLQKESYLIEAKNLDYYDLPPFNETVEDLFEADEEYLVYKINNKICGVLTYSLDGDFIEICKLFVSPKHLYRGIATSLLKKLEEQADNVKLLKVKTGLKNIPAKNFYNKHRFKMVRISIVDGFLKIAEFEKQLVRIRKAKAADAPQIKNLLALAWDDTFRDKLPKPLIEEVKALWHNLKHLREQIKDKNTVFNIAEAGNTLVGILTAWKKGDKYYLNRLYVLPGEHGKGIGKKLLHNLIRDYRASEIELEVVEENQKAIGFYIKEGFIKIGHNIERLAGFDLKTLVMNKKLANELTPPAPFG
jgi:ribosomal protein S18 acetylase RimI-like enzyme